VADAPPISLSLFHHPNNIRRRVRFMKLIIMLVFSVSLSLPPSLPPSLALCSLIFPSSPVLKHYHNQSMSILRVRGQGPQHSHGNGYNNTQIHKDQNPLTTNFHEPTKYQHFKTRSLLRYVPEGCPSSQYQHLLIT
jgi:hypothetical protein